MILKTERSPKANCTQWVLRVLLAAAFTLFLKPLNIWANGLIDRKWAAENMEANIASALDVMNSDPKALEQILIYKLARPVGEHQRVLETCQEVIFKSTNPASTIHALLALESIMEHHLPRKRNAIVDTVKHAMDNSNQDVRLVAAGLLKQFGNAERARANLVALEILVSTSNSNMERVASSLIEFVDVPEVASELLKIAEKGADARKKSFAIEMIGVGLRQKRLPRALNEKARDILRRTIRDRRASRFSRFRALDDLRALDERLEEEMLRLELTVLLERHEFASDGDIWAYVWRIRRLVELQREDLTSDLRTAINVNEVRRLIAERMATMSPPAKEEWLKLLRKMDEMDL